jgi:hypothetical protein
MIISAFEVEARKHQSELLDATSRYLKGEINGEQLEAVQSNAPRQSKRRWFTIKLWPCR